MGTLRRFSGAVASLDPAVATNNGSEFVVAQLYERLVAHPNGEPDPTPSLATAWTVSDDHRQYRFTLGDSQFHDGRPVTAADVAYSFERVASAPDSQHASLLLDTLGVVHETDDGAYVPGSLGVEAVDDRTVELRLVRPFHAALDVLAHPALSVLPAGAVDDVPRHDGDRSRAAFADEPVGSGPFRLESWDRDPDTDDYEQELTLVRATTEGSERFDRLRVRTGPDPDHHWESVVAGETDVFSFSPDSYDPDRVTVRDEDDTGRRVGRYELPNGRTVSYCATPTLNTFYLAFDTTLVSRPLRRAVAAALDVPALIERAFGGRHRPATHLTPPSVFPGGTDAYEAHAARYPHGRRADPETARERLAAVDDPTLELAAFDAPEWEGVVEPIADQLDAVGIETRVVGYEIPELTERVRAGEIAAHVPGWLADWPAADGAIQPLDPPRTRAGADERVSYFEWGGTPAAERARAAFERLRANPEPTERAAAARAEAVVAVEEAAWRDVPLVPLYHNTEIACAQPWVDLPPVGTMGMNRYAYDAVTLERDGRPTDREK